MFRLDEWRAGATAAKRGSVLEGRLWVAIHLSVAALVAGTPTGLSAAAEDVPRGPYYRVKGLPAGATVSGGQTNAEHTWMVPLWAVDDLKIEIPSGLSGNLDLLFGLVDDDDVVLSERTVEVRVTPAVVAAPSGDAADGGRGAGQRKQAASTASNAARGATREPAGATSMSVGPGGRPEDAPLGPYVRIKGLPGGVTLSGGYTDAGRPWTVPLANGERAWMVPLRTLDDIKIEISSGLSGNLDLLFGLVDDDGVVLSERTVEVRVTPAVVATPSRLEPGATQSMDAAVTPPPPPLSGEALDAVVATSASPPSGAASGEAAAVAGGPEPKAAQREDAVVAPSASPPSGAASGEAAAVAGGPEPKAAQREDAVVARSAPPPRGAASGEAVAAAPSGSEPKAAQRKDATVATAAPSAIGLAATFVKRGQDFIANGDLAAARLVLRRAADGGDAQAAHLLGSTYDPAVFKQLKVIGLAPDPAQARVWYQRAVDLGSAEAVRRLEPLAQGAR